MCATGRKKEGDREIYEDLKIGSWRPNPRIHRNDRYNFSLAKPVITNTHCYFLSPHFLILRKVRIVGRGSWKGILNLHHTFFLLCCREQGERD
jgi:hypothetical protein